MKNGMTIQELAEELNEWVAAGYGDQPVHFAYKSGDHWGTVVAPQVRQVNELPITHSPYHNMDRVMDEAEVDPDRDDYKYVCVILAD